MLSMIDASIDRVEEINQSPQIDIDGKEQTPDRLDIEMQDVSFPMGIKSNRPCIAHNSTRNHNGDCRSVGFWKNNTGKFNRTLLGLDSGSVRIGGIDVKDYKLDSLMKNISMVFQNVYLFPDTIENNIKFGCPDATHEQVVAAAKAACCHDFISALPNGYGTVIGEGGSTLSGGEKQRISIARAILKDAPIVILDEATASVDPENEHLIQQALSALTKGKPSSPSPTGWLPSSTRIRFWWWRMAVSPRRGTHAELMAQGGLYRRFIESSGTGRGLEIGVKKE